MSRGGQAPMTQSGKKTRTANAGRRVIHGRVYDSKLGETCHWCRQKTVEDHVYCSRCPIRFCGLCLTNRHGELILEEMQIQWVCPKCRGGCGKGCSNCCNCGPCRKAQDLAPTGCVIHRARVDGFDNVHDYLIHLTTEESCQEIARRKAGKKWTKAGGAEASETIVPAEPLEKPPSLLKFKKRSRCKASGRKAEVESDWSAGSDSQPSDDESESALECLDGSSEEDDEAAPAAATPAATDPESNGKGGNISHLLGEAEEDDEARRATRLEKQMALRHASLNKKKTQAQSRTPTQPRLEQALETPVKVKQKPDWIKVKQEPDWEPDVEDEHEEETEVGGAPLKSVVQELSYKELLQEEMDRPFDSVELDELLEEVSKRKPVKRHMETRSGTRMIETRSQGMSYLDYHPDLSSKLSAAVASLDKLKLLRGFFFWIKHACKEGAFQPWTSGGALQEEDCQLVDGFDCEITSVVVSLNARNKNPQQQQQQPLRRVKVKTEIE